MHKANVLIVDDEINIIKSLESLFAEQAFNVYSTTHPGQALELITKNSVNLVLLDIWMPEMDGHTLLKHIKAQHPKLPVIIMSGHAGIDTTAQTTRSGADDFVEKPFHGESLIRKIQNLLQFSATADEKPINPADKLKDLLRESHSPQQTLKGSTVIKGKGLHSGASTGIILSPMPENTGIIFEDIASGDSLIASGDYVDSTSYSTNLRYKQISISVVEHLMSTLHAFGIDNASIKVNKEIPILDGSSAKWCELIENCGIEEQQSPKRYIHLDKTYTIRDEKNENILLEAKPSDKLQISYTLEWMHDNRLETYDYLQEDIEKYKREIAPARTFGFLEELKALQSYGLGQGGDLENFIMLNKDQALNTELRFPEEPARHKILDIIGDLYLLGFPLLADITAVRSGHRHNIQLVQSILKH